MAKASVDKPRIKTEWTNGVLTIQLPNEARTTIRFNENQCSAQVHEDARHWGYRQKIVNGFAQMMNGAATRWGDIEEEINRRIRALYQGHWSHSDVGQRFGDMVRAFVAERADTGKPIAYAEAEEKLMALSEEQRKPIYDDPKIRVRMLAIMAERVKAQPQVPTTAAPSVLDLI